jgi:hypothetical protein
MKCLHQTSILFRHHRRKHVPSPCGSERLVLSIILPPLYDLRTLGTKTINRKAQYFLRKSGRGIVSELGRIVVHRGSPLRRPRAHAHNPNSIFYAASAADPRLLFILDPSFSTVCSRDCLRHWVLYVSRRPCRPPRSTIQASPPRSMSSASCRLL